MTTGTSLRHRFSGDTEFNQSVARIGVVFAAFLYYFWLRETGFLNPDGLYRWLSAFGVVSVIFSIALSVLIYVRPGIKNFRRLVAVAFDFGGCTILLSVDGYIMLPTFGALLWVTVGYGIRYGGRYLILTSCISLLCIAVVIFNNAYWQENLFQTAAFVLTLIIGPGYAFALISRLQQAHEAAQAANQRKSRFVAQVSHDVRQPIHAISLLTARLNDSTLTEVQAGMVDSINHSVDRAIQQLQTFLNITTIEAGLIKPRLEPVLLGQLLQDIAAQHADHAAAAGSAILVINTKAVVSADRVFVWTMLQNLISNAIKHAPGAEILLGCRRTGGQMAICVYDRGPGIAAEHLPRLTERYFRLLSGNESVPDGTGLGLAIVQQLADMLGLTVRIVSREGHGTAIWVEGFQLSRAADPQFPNAGTAAKTQLAGLDIALIDDDLAALRATRDLLLRWGCNVTTCTHPPVELAQHDIIVSDFEFADGSTIADHQTRWRKRLPMIVVSGHPRETVGLAMSQKPLAILEKPLRAGELRSALLAARILVAS